MSSTTTEPLTVDVTPFRESHWTTQSLFIGLVVLLLWRSTAFLDRTLLSQVPWWLLLIAAGLLPQLFLLLFPIFTRRPASRLYIPNLKRCLTEVGIAIPVTLGILAILAGVNYLADRISPGTSLVPDVMTRMSESHRIYLYPMLLFSFTFAPVAEEIFFRGFLQNAFRQRMPLLLAIVAQSAIFGACHFFGAIHSVVTFVLGLLLTLLYEWRRTLIAPIAVHAGINAVAALGVAVMAVGYANSPALGVIGDPNGSECVIRQVVSGTAADKAGLQVGDVVISFNGQPIHDFPHLRDTVRLYKPGDIIPVAITRAGAPMEIDVILQRRGTE